MGGIEGELLPGLIAGGHDLHDERGGRVVHLIRPGAMQGAIGGDRRGRLPSDARARVLPPALIGRGRYGEGQV